MAGAVTGGKRKRAVEKKKPGAVVPEIKPSGEDSRTKAERLEGLRLKIFESLPAVVDALIEQATSGSYQHAKCLFDLARLAEVKLPKEMDPQGWAAMMLQELRAIPISSGQPKAAELNPSRVESQPGTPFQS